VRLRALAICAPVSLTARASATAAVGAAAGSPKCTPGEEIDRMASRTSSLSIAVNASSSLYAGSAGMPSRWECPPATSASRYTSGIW
jgi:hypothetical protein